MKIEISGFKKLKIKNLIFDYNGTLAKDGKIDKKVKKKLERLSKDFNVFVITADTFGTVEKELKGTRLKILILKSKNHTKEKKDFVKKLNSKVSVAIGNGNNDALMLKRAEFSVAIVGNEGCSKNALKSCDIICKDIKDALGLFLKPKRVVATLRR